MDSAVVVVVVVVYGTEKEVDRQTMSILSLLAFFLLVYRTSRTYSQMETIAVSLCHPQMI